MLNGAVTNRYARALFAAAGDADQVEAVDQALQMVAQAVRAVPDLLTVLVHPVLPVDEKTRVLESIFGDAVPPLLQRLLRLLFVRERGEYIQALAVAFHNLANESRGRLQIELESAESLDEEQLHGITSIVGSQLDKSVSAEVTVRPELIAGYKLRIGNRVIDATLKGMLTDFAHTLSGGRVGKEGQL